MVDFLSIINSNKKPPAYEKWQEVYCTMAVHTQGETPEHIFRQRRPLEGQNASVTEYREENYRPITKDEFDKAISGYIEAAMNLDIQVDYKDSKVKEYEQKVQLKDGIKKTSLKKWMIKRNGAYRQTDPNAIVVVLPKHPTETFKPNYLEPIPNFDAITNQTIEVEYQLISHTSILAVDVDYMLFNAGSYRYGPKSKDEAPYYIGLTPEQTYLFLPAVGEKSKVIYKQVPYYRNAIKTLPAVVIGGKLVIEQEEDGETIEYYVSDYLGAAAWGDLTIGQQSDSQICEVRFTYPRHWVIPTKCKNEYSSYNSEGKHIHLSDDGKETLCHSCNGSGVIFDASPMGSRIIDLKGELFQEGKFTTPEGFITPPADILDHGAKRGEFYFDKMMSSLCVTSQNMTNQSAQSKSYDVQYKVAKNSMIITDLYLAYEAVLNITDEYLGGKGDVQVIFPEDFDVRNANDILYQLTELRSNKAPAVILIEFTKKYMLKAFGDSPVNKKILEFLSTTDKLFAYGTDDLQTVKSVYGSDITTEDIIYNTQAYPILKEMANKDVAILDKPFDELKAMVSAETSKYFPIQKTNTVA